MSTENNVFCPNCLETNYFDSDFITSRSANSNFVFGNFIKCGNKFNIFQVLKYIVNNIHQNIEKITNGKISRNFLESSIRKEIFSILTPRETTTTQQSLQPDYISSPKIKFVKGSKHVSR